MYRGLPVRCRSCRDKSRDLPFHPDHLHFGIIVGGLEVTPIEWLDPKWVRNIVNNINGTIPAR